MCSSMIVWNNRYFQVIYRWWTWRQMIPSISVVSLTVTAPILCNSLKSYVSSWKIIWTWFLVIISWLSVGAKAPISSIDYLMQLWISQIMRAVTLQSLKLMVTNVIQEPCENCSPHFRFKGEQLRKPNTITAGILHSLYPSPQENPYKPCYFLQKARTSTVIGKINFKISFIHTENLGLIL